MDIDGKGWENIGGQHCWSPNKIKNLMEYLNNEKKLMEVTLKKFPKQNIKKESLEQILSMG